MPANAEKRCLDITLIILGTNLMVWYNSCVAETELNAGLGLGTLARGAFDITLTILGTN